MRATISRQYREGNWSVYSEDIDHLWQDFISSLWFQFDEDNESHRWYANGFIQAKFGKDARVHLDWA
jgi:hypothetical protein